VGGLCPYAGQLVLERSDTGALRDLPGQRVDGLLVALSAATKVHTHGQFGGNSACSIWQDWGQCKDRWGRSIGSE
jgi:hypothetical protein